MLHFAAFRLGVSHFYFSLGYGHMGKMDFISSIFVRFFSNLSGKHFIDHTLQVYYADQCSLFVHSTLILKQWRHSGQHVYSCTVWSCSLYRKAFRDKQCNYICSLVSVFCSRLFSVKQLTFENYTILCQYSYHSFI